MAESEKLSAEGETLHWGPPKEFARISPGGQLLYFDEAACRDASIGYGDSAAWAKLLLLVLTAERERCAQVCESMIHRAEDWDSAYWDQACETLAFSIRKAPK